MLIPGSTSWLQAIPVFAVAAALLFVPGAVAALLLRVRLLAALALGPALSTTCIAVGGMVAPELGLRWGTLALTLCVVTLWSSAAGAGALIARWGTRRPTDWYTEPVDSSATLGRWRSVDPILGATAVGLLIAFAVFLASVLPEARSPEAFPQQPDAIFHLAVPQWMNSVGTISSFSAEQFVSGSLRVFYPAAFHGFTATISLLTGASVVVSTSAFVLVVAGLAWPLGCVVLALTLFGRRPVVAMIAPVASVLFTAYPYSLMSFGIIWPNLFGQALLPACLAALVAAVGPVSAPRYAVAGRVAAGIVVAASLPGLLLAHPNALMSFGVFGGLLILGRAGAWAWTNRRRPRLVVPVVAAILAALALTGAVLLVLRPPFMYNTGVLGPGVSARTATLSMIAFAPNIGDQPAVATLLVLAGSIIVLRKHRGVRWVVAGLVLMLALFWLSRAVDNHLTRLFTWPWYNNAWRLQAASVLPAALVATATLVGLRDVLARFVRLWRFPQLAAAVVMVLLLASTGGYLHGHQSVLHLWFHPPRRADYWVTNAELRSLRALSQYLPADAVVAADPWNGGTYLYVVSGRRLLIPTEKANITADRQLLGRRLNEVGQVPAVCSAAQRQHVKWAITGGTPFSWAHGREKQYLGIDSVGSSPAWQVVARDGDYTLYRMIACAPG